MYKIIITIIVFFSISTTSFSQDRTGKTGLLIIGDPFNPSSDFGISVWVSNNIIIEPLIGFTQIDPKDIPATKNLRIGLDVKYYFNKKLVDPFIGLKYGYNSIYAKDISFNDISVGILGGSEYFLADWFSLGWEFHFDYTNTDDEYSPMNLIPDSIILHSYQNLILKLYIN